MCRLPCTAVLAGVIAAVLCKKVCIFGPAVTACAALVYDN
jgi:hypothetical protein